MSKEVWLQFSGAKQIATWLLNTDRGRRFLDWFLKKYFRQVMAMSAGAELVEYLRSEIKREEDSDRSRPIVVIETHPDGFMRVYGSKVSVCFAHRIATPYPKAEAADEERCWLETNAAARAIYLDDTKLLAYENIKFHPSTIEELVSARTKGEVFKSFSAGMGSHRSSPSGN